MVFPQVGAGEPLDSETSGELLMNFIPQELAAAAIAFSNRRRRQGASPKKNERAVGCLIQRPVGLLGLFALTAQAMVLCGLPRHERRRTAVGNGSDQGHRHDDINRQRAGLASRGRNSEVLFDGMREFIPQDPLGPIPAGQLRSACSLFQNGCYFQTATSPSTTSNGLFLRRKPS